MKYIQVDNVIGQSYLNRLTDLVSGMNGFPWFFLSEDVAYSTKGYEFGEHRLLDMKPEEKTVGFTHLLLDQGGIESPYLPAFQPLLDNIQDAMSHPVTFFRVRLALQLNNGIDHHNGAHTDSEEDHYAALFYFHDSSGDTVFFDQYDDPESGTVDERWFRARTQEYTVKHRVTPQANKLFVFDGHQFHSSSNPVTNPYRVILNLNFKSDYDLFDSDKTVII